MNADDDQRADDLEAALDEADVARAAKMAKKWSSSGAEVALDEVQRRNAAHRQAVEADASTASGSTSDLTRFTQRDEDIASLRQLLA